MFVVVSYDIPDDKRRMKVCKLLKNYGAHVQYSVFECVLKERDYAVMRKRLKKLIVKEEDSVRFYFLCREDVKRVQWIGGKEVARERDYYLH
jgi:CRISPR-associated protein Cas2